MGEIMIDYGYNGPVRAVVLDWAGTVLDYGCFAPLQVFLEIFQRRGIEVTIDEARKPMGMMKRDHIATMCKMPRISDLWRAKFGEPPSEADIDALYADFEPALLEILPDFGDPIPGALETVAKLRERGIKIGSSTGYTQTMMDVVVPLAKSKGYSPDFVVNSSMVPSGRPAPYMLWCNCIELEVPKLASVVKVGDTIADIKAGRNGGVWTAGVLRGGSLLGLSREETETMKPVQLEKLMVETTQKYVGAGAHYVIDTIADLPEIIDDVERRLANGDHPETPMNKYKLFTPGPLTTTASVKREMLTDWGSRNDDYKNLVEDIRKRLVKLASKSPRKLTTALIQGSGTFAIEATIGTAIPEDGKLLVLVNGAYGRRMVEIAKRLNIQFTILKYDEFKLPDIGELDATLALDDSITHVAAVHCETTTGIINPAREIGEIVAKHDAIYILDAMSSFGGIPLDMDELHVDYLVSSANKCIQGVPGFAYVIARKAELENCEGNARSLSLDLFDNWRRMEEKPGSWRFTSPVHAIRAFHRALIELEQEGGVVARFARYSQNQRILANGMGKMGFEIVDFGERQSPIISTFYSPKSPDYNFSRFYRELGERGFVIYPGKTTMADTFRIGTIGELHPSDIRRLLAAIEEIKFW